MTDSIILGPPMVGPIQRLLGYFVNLLFGWKLDVTLPTEAKSMIVYYPHTTNWDFVHILGAVFKMGIKPTVMAKQELFKGPGKWFFTWTGCIPINRRTGLNTVDQMVMAIEKADQIVIGIAPEGSRRNTKYWKTGFYRIAQKANIPIYFAYLDYERKVAGYKYGFVPSGDLDLDMNIIREFFSGVKAKYPEEVGEIRLKPRRNKI